MKICCAMKWFKQERTLYCIIEYACVPTRKKGRRQWRREPPSESGEKEEKVGVRCCRLIWLRIGILIDETRRAFILYYIVHRPREFSESVKIVFCDLCSNTKTLGNTLTVKINQLNQEVIICGNLYKSIWISKTPKQVVLAIISFIYEKKRKHQSKEDPGWKEPWAKSQRSKPIDWIEVYFIWFKL